jgi:hypothetical protein
LSLTESIQRLRDNPDVPDLSEPTAKSANDPPEGNTGVVDMSEDGDTYDLDAPGLEDYKRGNGSLDSEAYLHDSAAHNAIPLSDLTTAERRKRFASNR